MDDIPTHVFGVRSAYDISSIKALRKYLLENKVDVLCTHDYRTHTIGLLSVRNTPTKWVAFSRGWTWENLKIRAFHLLDKCLIRFADHIVAVSHSQKRKLQKLIISGKKISVVHNAIDTKNINQVDTVDLRAKFGFPPNALTCISAGRFSPEKGQANFIKAAAKASNKHRNIYFVLFGDGPDLQKAKSMITDLGLDERILCPGFEKNLIGCLKRADILVNPSLSEGLPNIVLEAMAVGTPVIASSVGGVPEIIEDGFNGYLVSPSDIDGLTSKISLLVSDNNARERVRENAELTVTKDFSFEAQSGKLYSIYDNLYDRIHPRQEND